jgi:hypothetical protein
VLHLCALLCVLASLLSTVVSCCVVSLVLAVVYDDVCGSMMMTVSILSRKMLRHGNEVTQKVVERTSPFARTRIPEDSFDRYPAANDRSKRRLSLFLLARLITTS